MSMCISDVPVGSNVRVSIAGGTVVEGRVITNYGSSITVKKLDKKGIIIGNTVIDSLEFLDEESLGAYQVQCSKSNAEFKQILDKLSEGVSDE